MPTSATHLSEWILEQLAEGELPVPEHQSAMRHLDGCARCSAELEAYRSLFTALSELPRFAPAEGFDDLVMARVRVAPPASSLALRIEQWLPSTRRGWLVLLAALGVPSLSLVGVLFWFLTHPLVSPRMLGEWFVLEASSMAAAGWTMVAGWGRASGVASWVSAVYGALERIPMDAWMVVIALLALAIPLSAWAVVRLARTPTENVTYAN